MTDFKIAYGNHRYTKHWKNTTTTWEELLQRLANTHRTSETVAQYAAMSKAQQGEIKDLGGFVAGHLSNGRRKRGLVLSRSMLTLDIDYPEPKLNQAIASALQNTTWAMYSTHSHRAGHERYRLIIPLAAPVKPDAYEAIARAIAARIGIDQFDDTTYEPHRLMYWPSTPADGDYVFEKSDGVFADPGALLREFYDDWRDVTTWPVSSRQNKAISAAEAKKVADPLTKEGIVGAFCRSYAIEDAIDRFLPEVYAPSTVPGRYDYISGESTAGLVTYDNKFAYSHHATDPAGGQLLNAYDLVRIHLYGELDTDCDPGTRPDRLPSSKEMNQFVLEDPVVKTVLNKEREAAIMAEFEKTEHTTNSSNWVEKLTYKTKGKGNPVVEDTLPNLVAILTHDPALQPIALNEFTGVISVTNPLLLPWEQTSPGQFTDNDLAQVKNYIQAKYGVYSAQKTQEAILIAAAARAYHPVKQYLESLPAWDGKPRTQTLLHDYLGAELNEYTQQASRLFLTAAVARIYRPGVKYDQVLILVGPQGCGKSTLFARLGGDWFSDNLTLTDMRDKTGAEKLVGNWIAELSELSGMRKMEAETVKAFITRQEDKYRPAYGKLVESHPRQSIIVGTTNAEEGFLRDVTGNRRFLPITVTGKGRIGAPWELDDAIVAQIWAEALKTYQEGTPLYLTGEALRLASQAQQNAVEADERAGLVEEYLNTPVPADFKDWGLNERTEFYEFEDQTSNTDLVPRDEVSNMEIWVECFGEDPSDFKPADAYRISAIMAKMPGWEKASAQKRSRAYGKQRVYVRRLDVDEFIEDVLGQSEGRKIA